MRILYRAALMVAVAAWTSSCGGGGGDIKSPGISAGPLTTYTNSEQGFTIRYPSDWSKVEGGGGALVAFGSPKEGTPDAFEENVTVSAEDLPSSSITLDQYTEAALGQVRTAITGFHLESSEDATVAGNPGHRIVYTGSQGQFRLRWQQAFTIVGDKAWILTFVAQSNTFDRYVATAQAMFESFGLS